MKRGTWLFGSIVGLLLAGCSNTQPIEMVKDTATKVGKSVGLVTTTYMKTPDYYSTKQLEKKYEFGSMYDVSHIDCAKASNRCQ